MPGPLPKYAIYLTAEQEIRCNNSAPATPRLSLQCNGRAFCCLPISALPGAMLTLPARLAARSIPSNAGDNASRRPTFCRHRRILLSTFSVFVRSKGHILLLYCHLSHCRSR